MRRLSGSNPFEGTKLNINAMRNEKFDGQLVAIITALVLVIGGFVTFIICEGSLI